MFTKVLICKLYGYTMKHWVITLLLVTKRIHGSFQKEECRAPYKFSLWCHVALRWVRYIEEISESMSRFTKKKKKKDRKFNKYKEYEKYSYLFAVKNLACWFLWHDVMCVYLYPWFKMALWSIIFSKVYCWPRLFWYKTCDHFPFPRSCI